MITHKPVYLMSVQEAHKEYNSLIDQIRGKFGQLEKKLQIKWNFELTVFELTVPAL